MKEVYSNEQRRWYDKDPILSNAVKTLEASDDETQIRIALNLIKIINGIIKAAHIKIWIYFHKSTP